MRLFGRNKERALTTGLYQSETPEDSNWYPTLLKSTLVGTIAGLPMAIGLEFSGAPNSFGYESAMRAVTGDADGLFEGGTSIHRRFWRKIKDGGDTSWYAMGKMFGFVIAVPTDYLTRTFSNIDIYSQAASFIPPLYSQGDLVIAYLALLGYHLFRTTGDIRQRIRSFYRNPVAWASIGVYGLSVAGDTLYRSFVEPNDFLKQAAEIIMLNPLCVIPPLVGALTKKPKL